MKKILIGAVVVLGVVASQALFVVQEVNQAIVLQFGDPKKIITKSGLNFKIPFIPVSYTHLTLPTILLV